MSGTVDPARFVAAAGDVSVSLAASIERASELLERLRQELLRVRDLHGLPFREEVPAGKRLVATGIVTHCCNSHVPDPDLYDADGGALLWSAPWLGPGRMIASCCDPDDCGPCCPDCPSCPSLSARAAGSLIG